MHFLVEVEGYFAGDSLCVQLINHLQKHCDKILKGDRLNFPRTHNGETASTSSNSNGGGGYSNRNGNIVPSGSSGLSGSPTSGSCSDTGRSEIKDSAMNNNIPQTRNQQMASVPPAEIEDVKGLVNLSGPSQLREMLTSSNLTTLQTSHSTTLMTRIPQPTSETMSQHLQAPQSPVPSFSSTQYSSGANLEQTCGSGSVASLYKLKNNIKQRFTAEHHPEDSGVMNSTNSGSDSMVNGKRCSSGVWILKEHGNSFHYEERQ
ncbi:hypothetical protein C0J52_20977 [Blattella germanica]|nr:hypothetical protein C0J52_20977 [Blattella germanica]